MKRLSPILIVFTLCFVFPCHAWGMGEIPSPRIGSFIQTGSQALVFDSQPESPPRTIWEPFHDFMPESREIFHSMLPWNWENRLEALGIGAITIPLLISKNRVQEHVDLHDGNGLDFVSNDAFYTRFEFLGDRWTLPALSGMFVLGGIFGQSQREVETGLMMVQSIFYTAAVTGMGQFILAEDRPYEGGELRFLQMHGHGISGHSSLAASMVKPLDSQYLRVQEGDSGALVTVKYLGKALLYASPVMVGASRVRSNRHYLWNVVLGVSVGYSVGNVVADVHERERDGSSAKRTWRLTPDPRGVSFSLQW